MERSDPVATVAHELRTPLAALRASLGLLAGGACGDMPPRALPLLEVGIRSSDRLLRLVEDLLDLERIEAGKLRVRLLPVDVRGPVRRSTETMETIARAASVRLDIDVDAMSVLADEDRIVQVMTNLLGNAIRFSSPGSSVEIRARALSEDETELCVRDHGPGIPPEFLTRIFGRFQQAEPGGGRSHGRLGLGLAISRAIVEEHGGRIGVRSTAGEGATFWFTLRRAPVTKAKPAAAR